MSEQVLITNLNRPHAAAHHTYISANTAENYSCSALSILEMKEKCTYVQYTKKCHEMEILINYSRILYCYFNSVDYMIPFILIFIICCILYIITIIVIVYSSLAPNIIAIIKHNNLSKFGGAIFAIAFSINLTNILEIAYRYANDNELLLCEIFTTNINLRCLLAGIFLILKPITVESMYYTREQIFYAIGLLITVSFMLSNNLYLIPAIAGVVLFSIILCVVFVQEHMSDIKKYKDDINEIHDKLENSYPVINPEDQRKLKTNQQQKIFQQFFASIEPKRLQLAYRSNYWQKIILIVGLPVNTFIALFIPVYHPLLPLNGWSKLLNLLNLFIFPSIYFFVINIKIPTIIKIIYYIFALIFALYIMLVSSANHPPGKFHIIFAYLGNMFCIGLIHIIQMELMAILTILGYQFDMDRPSIGIYLLSTVKIIPVCILAATLASWGFHRMAFTIIVFSPMVLTNLVLAVLILVETILNPDDLIIRKGSHGPTLISFITIEFLLTFVATILLNFHLRKSFGYYLITLYSIFILFTALSTGEFVHSYGTDHTFEAYVIRFEATWA